MAILPVEKNHKSCREENIQLVYYISYVFSNLILLSIYLGIDWFLAGFCRLSIFLGRCITTYVCTTGLLLLGTILIGWFIKSIRMVELQNCSEWPVEHGKEWCIFFTKWPFVAAILLFYSAYNAGVQLGSWILHGSSLLWFCGLIPWCW